MYLNYSVGRQMPMRGVNWVTRDSNRLTNFSDRYAAVIRDIDVKRNEEELKIPLSDIRWNDHRRVYWKCSFCGSSYRKNVSVRVKYHAGCNACKGKFASEVLKEQTSSPSLAERYPELVQELAVSSPAPEEDAEKFACYTKNISGLSVTSKFNAEWTCRACGGKYRSSIRSRTGEVEEGQAPLHPQTTSWSAYCPSCRWNANLKPIGENVLLRGQYLGLDLEEDMSEGADTRQ